MLPGSMQLQRYENQASPRVVYHLVVCASSVGVASFRAARVSRSKSLNGDVMMAQECMFDMLTSCRMLVLGLDVGGGGGEGGKLTLTSLVIVSKWGILSS